MSSYIDCPCGKRCPPPFPGAVSYICTRVKGHRGMHVAEGTNGRVIDTWIGTQLAV